jgi:hypothetical protein
VRDLDGAIVDLVGDENMTVGKQLRGVGIVELELINRSASFSRLFSAVST